MKRWPLYLLLTVIPAAMAWTALWFFAAMGPSWVGMNHDPGLQYELNALNFATMRPVGHTVHPGTPVQMTGAVILRAVHFFEAPAGEDLESHVLSHPDLYLRSMLFTFLALQSLALFLLGAAVLAALKDISLALMVQLAPFYAHVTSTFLFGTSQVRPDSFLFLGSLLLAAGLVLYMQRAAELQASDAPGADALRQQLQRRAALFFGIVCGFAMAAKVGFLPLLVIPIFALEGHRHRVRYVVAMGLTFLVMTLPIIAEYPRMFEWIYLLAVHTGVHGQGSASIIAPGVFMANLKAFLDVERAFSGTVAISLALLAVAYGVPRLRKIAAGNFYFKSLVGLACAQVGGLALVAKHSQGWQTYYLMPVSVLTGLTLMLMVCCLVSLVVNRKVLAYTPAGAQESGGSRLLLPVASALALVAALAVIYHYRSVEYPSAHAGQSLARDQRMRVHALVERDYPGYAKIYYLGSSAPAFSLFFSNSEAKFYYSPALEKLYPDTYFYDPFTSQFYDWYNHPKPFDEIRRTHNDRVVIQGPPFAELQADVAQGQTVTSFKAPAVPLIEVAPPEANGYGQRDETIYIFQPKARLVN